MKYDLKQTTTLCDRFLARRDYGCSSEVNYIVNPILHSEFVLFLASAPPFV